MLAPCLLGNKLILQKLTIMSIDWEDKIPEVLYKEWCKWVEFLKDYYEFFIPRYCFANEHGYIYGAPCAKQRNIKFCIIFFLVNFG